MQSRVHHEAPWARFMTGDENARNSTTTPKLGRLFPAKPAAPSARLVSDLAVRRMSEDDLLILWHMLRSRHGPFRNRSTRARVLEAYQSAFAEEVTTRRI